MTNNTDQSLEQSVITTRQTLISYLKNIKGLSMNFITDELLDKPPFSFLQTLVKLFVKGLGFARPLYTDEEMDCRRKFSKSEKIRFLVKILACVTLVSGERLDVFVSPAKVITGQDVKTTHHFLCALARASASPVDLSNKSALEVIEKGEVTFYQQSVRTRNAIVRIQALTRGRICRKRIQMTSKITSKEHVKKDRENGGNENCSCEKPSEKNVNNAKSDNQAKSRRKPCKRVASSLKENGNSESNQNSVTTKNHIQCENDACTNETQTNQTEKPPPERKCRTSVQKFMEEDMERNLLKVHKDLENEVSRLQIVMENEKDRQRMKLRERLQVDRGYSSGPSSPNKMTSVHESNNEPRKAYSAPTELTYDERTDRTQSSLAPPALLKTWLQNHPKKLSDLKNTSAQTSDACGDDLSIDQQQMLEEKKKVRHLENRYKQQLRKMKEMESQLKEKEEDLEKRQGKVSKLAESLRKQTCVLHRKQQTIDQAAAERERTNTSFESEGRCVSKFGVSAPCKKCSKISSIREMNVKLQKKEESLKDKEERISRITKSLSNQKQRLTRLSKIRRDAQIRPRTIVKSPLPLLRSPKHKLNAIKEHRHFAHNQTNKPNNNVALNKVTKKQPEKTSERFKAKPNIAYQNWVDQNETTHPQRSRQENKPKKKKNRLCDVTPPPRIQTRNNETEHFLQNHNFHLFEKRSPPSLTSRKRRLMNNNSITNENIDNIVSSSQRPFSGGGQRTGFSSIELLERDVSFSEIKSPSRLPVPTRLNYPQSPERFIKSSPKLLNNKRKKTRIKKKLQKRKSKVGDTNTVRDSSSLSTLPILKKKDNKKQCPQSDDSLDNGDYLHLIDQFPSADDDRFSPKNDDDESCNNSVQSKTKSEMSISNQTSNSERPQSSKSIILSLQDVDEQIKQMKHENRSTRRKNQNVPVSRSSSRDSSKFNTARREASVVTMSEASSRYQGYRFTFDKGPGRRSREERQGTLQGLWDDVDYDMPSYGDY